MGSRSLKISLLAVLVIAGLAGAYLVFEGRFALRTATASVSRSLCGAAFISGVDPRRVFEEEQLPLMRAIGWAVRHRVNRVNREVSTTVFGSFSMRAVYRPGRGCLLVHDDGQVPDAAGAALSGPPRGEGPAIVRPATPGLRRALDLAFDEPDPAHPRHTKAVVVWHDGKLVAERYASGYGPDTRIWAHSISKSITHALVGILVQRGRLRPDQPVPIAAWRSGHASPRPITIDQLLRMTSGLPFDETGGALSLMNRMQFLHADMTAFAARTDPVNEPDRTWAYSNLGYMLLGRVIRDAAGGDAASVRNFMHRELFAPLGMDHTLVELDATGTPMAASQTYASARDLARFGQLYLDDGVVDGRRILPRGWVAYSHSQTLDTGYGAGFWINRVDGGKVPVWGMPWGISGLPESAYYARGAFGQYVVIVPSHRLVVVRLGISPHYGTDIGNVVSGVIDALPSSTPGVM